MIIHSILQQLEDDGFGTVGSDLQIGILPLDQDGDPISGIAVTPRGAEVSRTQIGIQNIDFYVRNSNPLTALGKSQEILEYLQESFSDVCDLPPLDGVTTDSYSNVTITPTSSVELAGYDDNGGVTYVVSGEVRYDKNEN